MIARWYVCLAVGIVSGVAFGIGTRIAASVPNKSDLQWKRACTIALDKNKKPTISCGDYRDRFVSERGEIVAAIGNRQLSLTCTGYLTHGPFGYIALKCDPAQQ